MIRSAAPVTQNHPSKPQDLIRQNTAIPRKSAPNISDSCVSCTASAMRNASLQSLSETLQRSHAANVFEAATKPSRSAHFWQGAESLAPATKNASTSKTGRCMWCFYYFDFDMIRQYSTCALRHSGVHFFNIPTSKRAPTLRRILTSKFALCHNGVHFFNNSTSKS